ncbi:MAG: hypothetical protein ACLPKB_22725 [Xanthobacteraceae bacterium]
MQVVVAARHIKRRRDAVCAVQTELDTRHGIGDRAGRQMRGQNDDKSILYDERDADRDGEFRPPKPARTNAHSCRGDSHVRYAMTWSTPVQSWRD